MGRAKDTGGGGHQAGLGGVHDKGREEVPVDLLPLAARDVVGADRDVYGTAPVRIERYRVRQGTVVERDFREAHVGAGGHGGEGAGFVCFLDVADEVEVEVVPVGVG